ncbi:MAG: acetylserotonin O-methyltransferase [Gemmataceae bacterium]|nr:acetylserotonin O-methyltransferase [Gemmataceae bacterium]MCI0740885.1 acetylserotonin O-methyltransferase [Gemmataceae bacterium]
MQSDPTLVLDLLEAFRRSKVLFTAVALGVFDALADGPQTAADLAEELNANPDALERLLNACVCLQLLDRQGAQYSNTPVAATYLCRSSPQRLTGYLNFSNDFLWNLWGNLEHAVREGGHRWKQTFGWDGALFSNFFRNENAKREFLLGMHGFGLLSSPQVVAAFDLGGFRRLIDLGGATGHLVIAGCERYPNLRGAVFDLAEALPLAREVIGASRVADRIDILAGDFFSDPLPQGDLYALGRILHDWTPAKILKLLTRIYERLPSGGGLLLAEKLLGEDKNGPLWAHMQDLNMLSCTEGKERTLKEYQSLLTQVGFADVAGHVTTAPLDAVLARKR